MRHMFIAVLFTVVRTWKQPRCPLTDEWIKKWWYIYTMEYSSAIKMNTFEIVIMRWMNLEPIIHTEVSQKEKDKYHILTYSKHPLPTTQEKTLHMDITRWSTPKSD